MWRIIKRKETTKMKQAKTIKTNKHPDWHLSSKEKFSYYVGDMGRTAAASILTIFMATFLLFQGVDPMAVAGVTAVIKVIDALDDVIFGYFVDRLKITEWRITKRFAGEGKYLPWYRLTFWTFPLAVILFFLMPRSLPIAGKLVWYTITYLLYDFTCTLSEVPMNSMIMTLTDNTDERSNVLKQKTIFATIFSLILGIVWPMLISEHVGLSVKSVGIVSAVVCFFFMLPLSRSVKEYNAGLKNVEMNEEKQYGIMDMLRCIKTNKYMAIYLLHSVLKLFAGASASVGLFASFYLFHDSMITTLATPLALVPGFLLQIFSDRIQKKVGRRNCLMYIMFFNAAVSTAMYFSGYGNIWIVIALVAIGGTTNFLYAVAQTFLIPDTIEYTRYKTGEDCSGIFYALISFVNKATGGLSGSIALAMLGLFGFQSVNAASFADLEGTVQPQSAMDGMWFLYALFPAICFLLSGLVMLLYNLRDNDAQLMAKCNAGEISRDECETRLSRKY